MASVDGRKPARNAREECLRLAIGDPRCGDAALVGSAVRLTALVADVADIADVPRTLVLTGSLLGWSVRTSAELNRLLHGVPGPVSVRAWLCRRGKPDRQVGSVLNNLPGETVPDAVIELYACALRGRARWDDRFVVTIQRFLSPELTVFARAAPADPEVRMRACWGVDEMCGEVVYYDQFVLDAEPGHAVVRERWAMHKPTATVASLGGTHTIRLPPERRRAPVLRASTAQRLGACASRAVALLSARVELEFVIAGGRIALLCCRPW